MKISKAELAANPNLMRLLEPQTLKELGLQLPENSLSGNANSTASTLKDAWKALSPEARRRLKGMEAKEHGIFGGWLLKHKIPFIHAPCHRKVHDLPPGWPDFTLFKRNPEKVHYPISSECLLLEMKVPGGVLSWEQQQWAKILDIIYIPDALAGIRLAATFYAITLPVLNRTKEMEF